MSNEAEGSVTNWVRCLRAGNASAAQPLWERYFEQLVWVARPKLLGLSQGPADAEDVASSAFGSFCLATREGRYPDINDREDLWKILVVITGRKAMNLRRDMKRRITVGSNPEARRFSKDLMLEELEGFVGNEPTPEQAAEVAEECGRLLEILDTEDPTHTLRNIAVWKLEGYTNAEIAEKLGCAARTVGNRLKLIRLLWEGPPRE